MKHIIQKEITNNKLTVILFDDITNTTETITTNLNYTQFNTLKEAK